jgi:hypothetical protein
MGRYPNNVDTMRKASGVVFKMLVVPIAKGGVGISGGEYMKLVTGQRPLSDAVAARLAAKFKCSIDDLRWKGTGEKRDLVPYQEPPPPAVRGRKSRSERDLPVEITIAIGGKLIGGLTMFDPRAMRRALRDAFGEDDGE